MPYSLAIFDFDGTLADSFPFFISVFNQVAAQHGFKAIEAGQVEALRRLSTTEILAHLGLPKWKVPLVAKDFMGLMRQQEAPVALFEGIEEALAHLKWQGMRIAVVSSNAQDNVLRALGPGVADLVSHLDCGVSMFGKASRIKKAMKRCGALPGQTIHVGDQLADLEAAHRAGVAFGAVSWGYAAIELLGRHGPEEIFESVSSLKRLV